MKNPFCILLFVAMSSCEYNLGPTVINTNTNTNTNTLDIHDLINFAPVPNPTTPVPSPNGGTETPLPLPTTAQATAQAYATANPTLLTKSCQAIYGESAWQFMDGLIIALKKEDARWGYMVKTTGVVSADVIAYRATSDNIGAWGVDVIVDLCGAPHFSWNVLGFDPNATWSGTRF
jgi:hypothetical protein